MKGKVKDKQMQKTEPNKTHIFKCTQFFGRSDFITRNNFSYQVVVDSSWFLSEEIPSNFFDLMLHLAVRYVKILIKLDMHDW